MQRFSSRLLIGLVAAPLMLVSSAAWAGLGACGNFEAVASGSCDFEVSGGCEAQCVPLNFVAACDGQCNASATADCTGGCEASCEADCDANPGSFECEGECSSTCQASCSGSCDGSSSCQAQCSASCDNRCAVQCKATPPSATCKAKCQASCDASCKVQANVDCSVDCSASLEGGCKVDCSEPEGALFCNGQYVDVGDNVDSCLDALQNIGFGYSVSCTGTECSASIGCAAAPAGSMDTRTGVGALTGLMVGLGMLVSRRRRRA